MRFLYLQSLFHRLALAGEIVAIKRAIHPVKYCDGDDSPLAYSNFENKGYALAIEQLNNPLTNMIDEIIGTVSSAMESCGHSYNIDGPIEKSTAPPR